MQNGKQDIRECLRHIAGKEEAATKASMALRAALIETLDEPNLTEGQLDELRRVCSAGIAAIKSRKLGHQYSFKDWHPGSKSPVCKYDEDCQSWDWDFFHRPWMDHLSRMVDKETKKVMYRSEPYELGEEAILCLAELVKEGWDVQVTGRYSTHFPGETVAVTFSEQDPDSEFTEDAKEEPIESESAMKGPLVLWGPDGLSPDGLLDVPVVAAAIKFGATQGRSSPTTWKCRFATVQFVVPEDFVQELQG